MCSVEEREDVAYDVIPMSYTNKDEHGRVESRTWLASTLVLGRAGTLLSLLQNYRDEIDYVEANGHCGAPSCDKVLLQ
jgi:hypothetical protein